MRDETTRKRVYLSEIVQACDVDRDVAWRILTYLDKRGLLYTVPWQSLNPLAGVCNYAKL